MKMVDVTMQFGQRLGDMANRLPFDCAGLPS